MEQLEDWTVGSGYVSFKPPPGLTAKQVGAAVSDDGDVVIKPPYPIGMGFPEKKIVIVQSTPDGDPDGPLGEADPGYVAVLAHEINHALNAGWNTGDKKPPPEFAGEPEGDLWPAYRRFLFEFRGYLAQDLVSPSDFDGSFDGGADDRKKYMRAFAKFTKESGVSVYKGFDLWVALILGDIERPLRFEWSAETLKKVRDHWQVQFIDKGKIVGKLLDL